jgi:4-hydroxybenzoate polyprenyltransferase
MAKMILSPEAVFDPFRPFASSPIKKRIAEFFHARQFLGGAIDAVKTYGRIILALILVILIMALLSFEAPSLEPDQSNYKEYGFWLQVESAIGYFIAVTAGAFVARRSFLAPALALAGLGWCVVVYILYDISRQDESATLGRIAADNVEGLFLYAIAAALGASLGRWYYKHEVQNATDTS